MTYNECQELLDLLMVAVERVVNSKLQNVVKSVFGVVRLVSGGSVYVRPSTDVSTPSFASPSSVGDLDDGDILMPNISGQTLQADDSVLILYTKSYDDGIIVRKY